MGTMSKLFYDLEAQTGNVSSMGMASVRSLLFRNPVEEDIPQKNQYGRSLKFTSLSTVMGTGGVTREGTLDVLPAGSYSARARIEFSTLYLRRSSQRKIHMPGA